MIIQRSNFACKLCEVTIDLHINDDSTYISKEPHKSFFGMELSTYRIKHIQNDENHVNAVILDQKGLFRGYLDAYVEVIDQSSSENLQFTINMQSDDIQSKNIFKLFYIVDLKNMQVNVFETLSSLNILNLIDAIQSKIKEAMNIYTDKRYFRFPIADMGVDVILQNGICFIFQTEETISVDLEKVVQYYFDYSFNQIEDIMISNVRILLYVIVRTPELDVYSLIPLLSNPLIFTKIDAKYPDKLPRIVRKLSENFPFSEEILSQLFEGEITLDQLLLQFPQHYMEIIEFIEHVNRRKLLE